MNLKLMAGASVLAIASAFAQTGYYAEESATPAAQTVSTAQDPAAVAMVPTDPFATADSATSATTAPVASGNLLSKLDVLRGNSYNFVGNELASTNVEDQLDYPYLMALGQFLYIEPTNDLGYVAFNKGFTFYGGLDNSSDNVGLFTAGIATPTFGIGFNLGLSKTFVSEGDADATVVNAGDDFGLTFAMNLGAYALSIEGDWLTTANETSTDDVEQDYWDLSLIGRVTNSPSAGDIGWTGGLQILRHSETKEANSNAVADPDSRLEFDPFFNIAMQILGNDMARVMIGSNNTFAIQMFDGGDAADAETYKDHTEFGLQLEPNIWADVALTENWLLFGGVSHSTLLFGYATGKLGDGTKESAIQLHTDVTTAQLGGRFQWKMLALEASFTDEIYTKTVAAVFNGDNLVANLGIFLNF